MCCRTPDADWGALMALLVRLETSETAEARMAFAARTWDLHVAAALQDAAEQGQVEELERLLLCYGNFVDAKDHDGTTALSSAAVCGHTAACALLLDRGASVHTTSNLDETPLHFAAREAKLACVMLLVDSGSDVRAVTKMRSTPIDYARRNELRSSHAVVAFLEAQQQQASNTVLMQQVQVEDSRPVEEIG